MPKTPVEQFDFMRVKNQILDRISIPVEAAVPASGTLAAFLPRLLKISAATLGSLLIVISLALGTAVAALESTPGQPIYPLKKVVENIQLRMASDEDEAANLQIKFANKRLEELEKVLEQNKAGEASEAEVSKAVADLQKTTKAAVTASGKTKSAQPKVAVLTKLVAQSAVLKSAAIESEGEVKLEIEKALETVIISQKQAIENIERAGLKVEAVPIEINVEPAEEASPAEQTETGESEEKANKARN